MFVIIMGCGRVGARVASQLSRAGHEVTILDTNPGAFRRLDEDYNGNRTVGNGIDADVLRRAGIERADVFIASTQGDNRNIMASEVARHIFNVPKVVARIYDPLRQETFDLLGIETISPTVVGANEFLKRIEPSLIA